MSGIIRIPKDQHTVSQIVLRKFDVTAGLERVQVRLGSQLIADHERSWGTALTITDPAHVLAARRQREAFQQPRLMPSEAEVVVRDLADYDTAFGVDIEVAS